MIKEEQKLQLKIEKYLKELQKLKYPVFFEKRQAGGFNYKKGIPDLYIVINSFHIEFEIKKEKGKLSTMQVKYQEMFKNDYKIDSYVIYDFKTAKTIIDTYLKYINDFDKIKEKIKKCLMDL